MAKLGRHGSGRHDVFESDHFASFLEDGGRALLNQHIEGASDRGIGRDSAGRVGTAAHGSYHQFIHAQRSARHFRNLLQSLLDPYLSGVNRFSCASRLLDHHGAHGPASLCNLFREAMSIETLASQGE